MEQRLQKALAAAGVGSRRKCEELIAAGRVSIDGKPAGLGAKADAEKSIITVDGLVVKPTEEKVYVLLNKPRGYTSTRSDPHAKRTVMQLVKDVKASLYPAGRLDVDTEGALILTNDGDFTFKLTHPTHEVPKTYIAEVRGRVSSTELARLSRGMRLEDGKTAPAEVRPLSFDRHTAVSKVEITIHEGRKRQVRRMFEALNHPVQKLTRTRIGSVGLGELEPGHWRPLSKREVTSLLKTAMPRPMSKTRSHRGGPPQKPRTVTKERKNASAKR